MALTLTYRLLREENWSDLVWLALLTVAEVGLSNVGLYHIPAAVGCTALAFLEVELLSLTWRENLLPQCNRYLLLAIPLVYPGVILALLRASAILLLLAFGVFVSSERQTVKKREAADLTDCQPRLDSD
jgi:hypothetical protein